MATLAKLEKIGSLIRIHVELEGNRQPWRCLYGTPDFVQWLDIELPKLRSTVVGGEIEPIEQVDAVFAEFVAGESLSTDRRFKKLSWTPEFYVWELKTLDVRIFGWVPQKDHFICAFGDSKDRVELLSAYGRYIAQTEYVRHCLDLDEPKSIQSKDYTDVLSDAD